MIDDFVPKTRNCDWNLKPGCHDHAIVQVMTADVPAIKCTDCIATTDTSRRRELRVATCDFRRLFTHMILRDVTNCGCSTTSARTSTIPVLGTLEVPGSLSSYKLQARIQGTVPRKIVP